MELEERVAELERRLALLERPEPPVPARAGTPEGDDLGPLQHLKELLAAEGAPGGGVRFLGSVRLPGDQRYQWQFTRLTDEILDSDWSGTAESFAALGHGVRLRLLREILGGTRTAAELAALEDIGTTGQIYHHLRLLTGAGWLSSTGRGRYEVPAPRVVPLLVMLSAAKP